MKTVKIQILRIRFLRQSESNFSVYKESEGAVTIFFEREISDDDPVLFCPKLLLNLPT
jgi:hypothetical protein